MAQAIAVKSFGGIEALEGITYNPPEPGPNEVQIQHKYIEVNYIDIYHRKGTYNLDSDPKILGVSAIGTVEKVGSKVKDFIPGDMVGYATSKSGGGYSEVANVPENIVVKIPVDLDAKIIAANLLKGITAHMLARSVYVVRPGIAVLIHAAAGGVGKILAQWCKLLGAYVIGTVGSEEKKTIAMKNGCHLAINYNTEDVVGKVKQITDKLGVNVVYDGVGAATFKTSIDCLMNIGMLVSYGASSGQVSEIDIKLLKDKSLFLTRPTIYTYSSNRRELLKGFEEFFKQVREGKIVLSPPIEFKLSDAAKAHDLIESRANLSSVILVP